MISDPYVMQVLDVRAQCSKCGRFVPWDAIEDSGWFDLDSEDPSPETWTNCAHCGRVEGVATVVTKVGPYEPEAS